MNSNNLVLECIKSLGYTYYLTTREINDNINNTEALPLHATTLNGHKIVVIRGVRKQANMYFHLEREGMFMNTSFNVFMNAIFKGLGLVQRHKLTISLYI
jgi:hypothetical protein